MRCYSVGFILDSRNQNGERKGGQAEGDGIRLSSCVARHVQDKLQSDRRHSYGGIDMNSNDMLKTDGEGLAIARDAKSVGYIPYST